MADRDGPRDPDVLPLAELEDLADVQPTRRCLSAGRWRRGSVLACACLVVAAIPVSLHVLASSGDETRRADRLSTLRAAATHASSGDARAAVLGAYDATIATRNFNFLSQVSETPASAASTTDVCVDPSHCGIADGLRGITLVAHGTVNLDPLAIVSTADVGSLGAITTWV